MAGTAKPALLIVDVQNDFTPGGALAVTEGDQVVPLLSDLAARFAARGYPVYASRDWHPADSRHFQQYGGTWPVHCVQGTPGAAFHPALRLPPNTPVISAGMSRDDEGYSAFEGRTAEDEPFAERLRRDNVDHLYVGGLATDYCVRASVLDALRHGLTVTLLTDASRGVNLQPGDAERAIEEVRAAGAELATTADVKLLSQR